MDWIIIMKFTPLNSGGARYYRSKAEIPFLWDDPAIGRWMAVDPMADEYPSFSPYNYCLNSPMILVDPDGNMPFGAKLAFREGLNWLQNKAGDNAAAQFAIGIAQSVNEAIPDPVAAVVDDANRIEAIAEGGGVLENAPVTGECMGAIETIKSAAGGDPNAIGQVVGAVVVGAVTAKVMKGPAVPNSNVVVRGGTTPIPKPGTTFSGSHGATLNQAARGVPHGQIRATTAGKIRASGGKVKLKPERTRSGNINPQHVNIKEKGTSSFPAETQPNPVPRDQRIK